MSAAVPLRGKGRVYCFERVSQDGMTGLYIWPSGRERFDERTVFAFPAHDEAIEEIAKRVAVSAGVPVDDDLRRLIECWDAVDRVLIVLAKDRSLVEVER